MSKIGSTVFARQRKREDERIVWKSISEGKNLLKKKRGRKGGRERGRSKKVKINSIRKLSGKNGRL